MVQGRGGHHGLNSVFWTILKRELGYFLRTPMCVSKALWDLNFERLLFRKGPGSH